MFSHGLRFVASDHMEREDRFLKKEAESRNVYNLFLFQETIFSFHMTLRVKRRLTSQACTSFVPLCLCVKIAQKSYPQPPEDKKNRLYE